METLPEGDLAMPDRVRMPGPAALLDAALGAWVRRFRSLTLAAALLSGLGIAVDAILIEPDWIEVIRTVEYVPGLRPTAPDLVLIHLSDLHVVRLGVRERRAIARINDAHPDLIVISGDLTRFGTRREDLEEFLGALHARYGIFAVWGNHDHWNGTAETWGPSALARAGVTLLRNENQIVHVPGGPIVVAGLDDPVTGHDNLKAAMGGVARSAVCLLLSHTPEIVRDLGNWDIDLVFAGHTHGGQVRLPGLGALVVPHGTRPYVEGWFDVRGDARLHVSQGLGWSMIPVRFFCRPRIDVISLRGGVAPVSRPRHGIVQRT